MDGPHWPKPGDILVTKKHWSNKKRDHQIVRVTTLVNDNMYPGGIQIRTVVLDHITREAIDKNLGAWGKKDSFFYPKFQEGDLAIGKASNRMFRVTKVVIATDRGKVTIDHNDLPNFKYDGYYVDNDHPPMFPIPEDNLIPTGETMKEDPTGGCMTQADVKGANGGLSDETRMRDAAAALRMTHLKTFFEVDDFECYDCGRLHGIRPCKRHSR